MVEAVRPRAVRHPSGSGAGWLAAVVLLLGGCAGSPSMLDPQSPQADHISALWWLMFAMAAAVFLIVTGLVVVAVVRRRRRDAEATTPTRDRRFVVVGGLVVPGVILAVIAVATVRTTNAVLSPAPGTVAIHVEGERWWWRVGYPDLGVTTANEIHVPVGERVDITVTSDNVIHSLWVPQLDGKVDLIPGQTNHLAFTARTAGTFRGQCAEFCGIQHAHMAVQVIAEPRDRFDAWVAAQARPAATPGNEAAQRGQRLVETTSCAGCHRVAGTQADGDAGPDLTHVASRTTIAAGALANTPAEMHRWLAETQQVKPGALMPQLDLSADDIGDLVAYLQELR
jgi:cytochrome c oxidase subunit II